MMKDNSLFNEHILAHELGKTIGQIREMTQTEYLEWQAYFKRRAAESSS